VSAQKGAPASPQSTSFGGQNDAQALAAQTWGAPHAMPQPPQFALSLAVFAQ
jgi:hypothetical protein